MRSVAGLLLILSLAACSKQEAPPAASPAAKPQDEPRRSSQSEGGPEAKPAGAQLAAPSAAPAVASPELLQQGEAIFTNTCATCHMADGYGVPNLQPQIVGSGWISAPDPQPLLSLILRGSAILGEAAKAYENDMAPQDHLSDAEIAAVATYVRAHFGAPPVTKPVTPAEVATARARPGLPQ